jgi:hypothetical protein
MRITFGLLNSGHSGAKSVTNSPSPSAGFIIASFTSAVTNSCGGDTSTSIRSTPRNGYGEQLTKTRKLTPSNAKHKLAGERTSKLIEAPPRQSGGVRHGGENAAQSDGKTSGDLC